MFGFDARASLVWLDPVQPGVPGAGVLCGPHADRLSPPRGWNLIDRRGPEPRLWIGHAAAEGAAPATPRRRDHSPRGRPCAPAGPRLPFDGSSARDADEPARQPWSPRARPGPELEHVLDARTPLLTRAFEGARPVDNTD